MLPSLKLPRFGGISLQKNSKSLDVCANAGSEPQAASKWISLPETELHRIGNCVVACFGSSARQGRSRKQLQTSRNRFLSCSFAQTSEPLRQDVSSAIPQRSSWNSLTVSRRKIRATSPTKSASNSKSGVYPTPSVGRPFTLSQLECNLLEFLGPGSYRCTERCRSTSK